MKPLFPLTKYFLAVLLFIYIGCQAQNKPDQPDNLQTSTADQVVDAKKPEAETYTAAQMMTFFKLGWFSARAHSAESPLLTQDELWKRDSAHFHRLMILN